MASENPDPTTETAMVRPLVRTLQDPGASVALDRGPQGAHLTGRQIVVMFTVAVVGLTVVSAVADPTALIAVSSAVTSLATGFLIGRRS